MLCSAVLRKVLATVTEPTPPTAHEGPWVTLNRIVESSIGGCVGYFQWAGELCQPSHLFVALVVLAVCAGLFCWRININVFGLNQFYRNRLVRCYLGATRWKPGLRKPHRFTGFDDGDDFSMTDLQTSKPGDGEKIPYRGPFPLVNCALNLGGSSDLDVHTRQSASFTLTPLFAGTSRTRVGYAPMRLKDSRCDVDTFAEGVTFGRAVSISGAAANPNMGYSTSPLVSALLTMFNVRLGWWFPNPGREKWQTELPLFSLSCLVKEFLGMADEKSTFVNVSDGGHFENLGIYELVRRRARVIIACDGECDEHYSFGSLGNAIRLAKVDFNARIELDVSRIRPEGGGNSASHCAVGKIKYNDGSTGYLIYLKSSLTGDEPTDVAQYHSSHNAFPHESTADQFFSEDQFESYRRLGYHIAEQAFRDTAAGSEFVSLATRMWDTWAPSSSENRKFLAHTSKLDEIWAIFCDRPAMQDLWKELNSTVPLPDGTGPVHLSEDEFCTCLALIQLMENVFVDLKLDEFWTHPDNRGWAMLFTMWVRSPKFREAWERSNRTFGIRFEYFCHARLGMKRENPVARVT